MTKSKIYLDCCCFNRPYDKQNQLRISLETQAKVDIQPYTDSENATICMGALVKAVGIVNAERFIAYMNRESGDYTLARRKVFDDMTAEELDDGIREYEESNPQLFEIFKGRTLE